MLDILTFIFFILLLAILAPICIVLYFITRWRDQKVLNAEDEQQIDELWQLCERLEKRVYNIEQVIQEK